METVLGTDLEEIKDFVQKTGSNLHLTDKLVSITQRNEWKLVENQRSFVQSAALGLPRAQRVSAEIGQLENWRMRGLLALRANLRNDPAMRD